ncbi:MAG: histidinol dehydrogenase [Candidatus Hadarchaeales archaeon]
MKLLDLRREPGARKELREGGPSWEEVLRRVRRILEEVRRGGDEALLRLTLRYDGVRLRKEELKVGRGEVSAAYRKVDRKTLRALEEAASAVERYHRRQLPRGWSVSPFPGVRAGQLVLPLDCVGVYVPGGLASYPSTALHTLVPARVAGVKRLVVCTPPGKGGRINPLTLVAVDLAGGDEIYRVGGAQAVAAMALGTETVPRVEKVVGPGNLYVTAAKLLLSPEVGIDFAAGPTELAVVADDSADPSLLAWDLLAQAEHDPHAGLWLLTPSEELARKVGEEVEKALQGLPRRGVAEKALGEGKAVITRDLEEALELANLLAPEHLQLAVKKPREALRRVRCAGTVLLGQNTPPAAGDFAVGPSHVLPTLGVARWRAGLTVHDFLRCPSVQELSRAGLRRVAPVVERLAEAEGLHAHAESVRRRLG